MEYARVKGMEDYYPSEYAVYRAIADALAREARAFGFLQVDMPAVETIKLLSAKSGEEVKQQIFVLEKRGTEELGLRFDLTVPMTRMFVTKQRELQKPVKWFAIAPMWRYEAPQKGRAREFTQLSCELFGSDKPEADATCINLIIACLKRFGLTSKDVAIRINNRKLLEGLLQEIIVEDRVADLIHVIDRAKKLSEDEFYKELTKLGLDRTRIEIVKKIMAINGPPGVLTQIPELKPNTLAQHGLTELQKTLELVDREYIVVDLGIARGLAYYTGNVFECFDREGKYRSLAGGGRYDELVGLFGGEATPATGFAIGFATLTLLLTEKNLLPPSSIGPDYYIAPVHENLISKALEIASKLREKYTVDVDLMRRKLAKQFEYANSIGARHVVILGEKDLADGNVTIRDMKSGKEEKVRVQMLGL